MLNRVHSNTTHLGPAIPLHSKLVVSISSLKKRLLSPSTTCNLPNHSPTVTWNNLLRTGRKLNPVNTVKHLNHTQIPTHFNKMLKSISSSVVSYKLCYAH
uniref:Uncharacterized protein n=1 Tax=Cajanus cajan TaxID=3821 RepID=A0A151RFS7_CAJCA|nr:hypothetical protein KK1_037191 [Cajanus cajan]